MPVVPASGGSSTVARTWIGARGELILTALGLGAAGGPKRLADAILTDAGRFRDPLLPGLTTLLTAVAARSPKLATAAACRLVGLGPGRTPLGDDYLAACALTVAMVGGEVGVEREVRVHWLSSILPERLVELTTPVSAGLMLDACRGVPPQPVAALLERDLDQATVVSAVRRSAGIGATSGRAWSAGIGAAAVLLDGGAALVDDDSEGET